jgi:hypothetical protein
LPSRTGREIRGVVRNVLLAWSAISQVEPVAQLLMRQNDNVLVQARTSNCVYETGFVGMECRF